MSTLKEIVERIDTLVMKRDMIEAIKGWLGENFTGSTGVKGRTIPSEVIDELLVDIDCALTAPVDEEIAALESMEVQDGKAKKGPAAGAKSAKKGRKGR